MDNSRTFVSGTPRGWNLIEPTIAHWSRPHRWNGLCYVAAGLRREDAVGRRRAERSGSVTLLLGPKAPAGMESNPIPTSAGGGFEVPFRFSGPEKPRFERTWRLPDIEETGS